MLSTTLHCLSVCYVPEYGVRTVHFSSLTGAPGHSSVYWVEWLIDTVCKEWWRMVWLTCITGKSCCVWLSNMRKYGWRRARHISTLMSVWWFPLSWRWCAKQYFMFKALVHQDNYSHHASIHANTCTLTAFPKNLYTLHSGSRRDM